MDITKLIQEGKLKIEQLDPDKTYVFKLGNEEFVPTMQDLRQFRDMITNMANEDARFPVILLGNMIDKNGKDSVEITSQEK